MTANLTPPDDRQLHDLHGKDVFFSLKVIDRSERFGRLLGLAEHIRPLKGGAKTETGRKGILPVETVDLGDELWRLEFRTDDVFLLVNERIPGLADRIRFDPAVFALIYPGIIRVEDSCGRPHASLPHPYPAIGENFRSNKPGRGSAYRATRRRVFLCPSGSTVPC